MFGLEMQFFRLTERTFIPYLMRPVSSNSLVCHQMVWVVINKSAKMVICFGLEECPPQTGGGLRIPTYKTTCIRLILKMVKAKKYQRTKRASRNMNGPQILNG